MKYTNMQPFQFDNVRFPEFKEVRTKDYIKNGDRNDYPRFLTNLYELSTLHSAIIDGKSTYISGKGLIVKEGYSNPLIEKVNGHEDLYSLIKKCVKDIEIYGGFYLEIILNKAKTGIAEINHLRFDTITSNKDNTKFFYSENWLDENGKENSKPDISQTYTVYSQDNKQNKQLFYYKNYIPKKYTYAIPSYKAGIQSIVTDVEIANFHQKSLANGFKGGTMIVFKNGVPTDEEMASTHRKLKDKFTNTDNANQMIVDFVDDESKVPSILPLSPNGFDKQYDELKNSVNTKIAQAHRLTSQMLFAEKQEGQLGGRNELIDAYQLFDITYIRPAQNIVEIVFNDILGEIDAIKIDKLDFLQREFSEATLLQVLTKDEIRSMLGKEPLAAKVVSNVADSLNALSPLLATKVLNELTKNEIRDIIGKEPIQGGDVSGADSPAVFSEIESRFELSKDEETINNLLTLNPSLTSDDISKFTKLDINYINNIKLKINRYK